jgi:flagellar biosynthesis chaperone FliJ
MKTRYTPLLKIKKSDLDKCERELQVANQSLNDAKNSLEDAYKMLRQLETPTHGKIQEMLQARNFITVQREVVEDKRNWVEFATHQLQSAVIKLKASNLEYEKFKYLDFEEIKKEMKIRAQKESKELDEIALMTYKKREES